MRRAGPRASRDHECRVGPARGKREMRGLGRILLMARVGLGSRLMDPVERIVDLAADRVAHGQRRGLLGLGGAPGVGKSTLAETAVDALETRGIRSRVLPMDGFHLPQARLRELGRRERMGAPDTFDVAGFVATLRRLRDASAETAAPAFDREIEEPVPHGLRIDPAVAVVVVEGNYLLLPTGGWEAVAPLLDEIVRLALNPAERRARLIERHVRFGKTPVEAAAWVDGPDERNAELIERSLAHGPSPQHWLRLD